jgi:HEAT repeat protein
VEPLIARLKSSEGLQAAVALAKFGDARAVKPLIDVLDEPERYPAYNEQKRTRLAFETLVKMGTTAVEPLIAALGKSISTNPDLSPEAVLVEIGEPAVEPLIVALKVRRYWELVRALAKIGDRRACGPIIDYIFQSMVLHSEKSLHKLFGSYYELIDNLINGVTVKEVTVEEIDRDWYEDRYAGGPGGGRTTYTTKEYSFTNSFQALEKLISIDRPVSGNLLHKVKNIPIGSIVECRESFEQMRRKAAEELIRRGNPPYDPSVYLDAAAWS